MVAPYSESIKAYWSQWERLLLENGVLYRLWETPAEECSIKLLVAPRDIRAELLQHLHSSPTAGHLGVNKTLGRVRERFYWVQCSKDVCSFCRNCDLCSYRDHRGSALQVCGQQSTRLGCTYPSVADGLQNSYSRNHWLN